MSRLSGCWITVAMVASLAAIAASACAAWPFTVDDAYIVASYARQLHVQRRYSLDGVEISDGVTGPLWLLPYLLGEVVGVSSVATAKALGGMCVLVAVALVLRRMRARFGSLRLVVGVGLLCACQSDLAIWSVGGLETGAATLLLVTAALSATSRHLRSKDHVCLGASIALLAWLRPELALAAAVLLACAWMRGRRGAWIAIALSVVGLASALLFRWLMFGHLWPLSALAKPAELGHGARYLLNAAVLMSGVVGAGLFARGIYTGRGTDRWLGATVVAHCVAVMLAGGDWMPGFRLMVPVAPLYAAVAAVGAVRMPTRWLGTTLVCVSCVLPLTSLAVQIPQVRASGDDRDHRGGSLARWLELHACHVALVDVGYLVYASGVRAFDLAGVTDVSIARLPGGHVEKRIPPALILDRDPDTLVLRGKQLRSIASGDLPALEWLSTTESTLARSPQIRARYRAVHVTQYAPGYVYYVLQRDPDEMPQSCPTR